ncbi:MAG: hypothetical protein HY904_02415 [Deltaproteobacteria bacterium]|nr:hypothetical protein [Deltaproteobacteria bacterium]
MAAALLLLLAAPAAVDRAGRDPRGLPEVETDCDGAELFGGTRLERGGWCQAREGRYASVRTLAETALAADEDSWRAHVLLGLAHHFGEGNLPRALVHHKTAEALFQREHPGPPDPWTGPWFVHRINLFELVSLHGEMNLHTQQIAYVDRMHDRLGTDFRALKAWPYIKMRRFEDARRVSEEALALTGEENEEQREDARTALCAVESELQNRQGAYERCLEALRPHWPEGTRGGVQLVNAAIAAEELLKFDESERFLLEASRREVEGTINPWARLAVTYMRQARFPEAVSALREMHAYRAARPPHLDQQDDADLELVGAQALLLAGRTDDAQRITARVVHRPERLGSSSAAIEQHESGNWVMDHLVQLVVARELEEQASWSPWRDALELRVTALWHRAVAWLDARRAQRLVGVHDILASSVRPDCPGSMEVPPWLKGALVGALGPGVVLSALARARAVETLPATQSAPYFDALEAEALWRASDDEEALATVRRVLPLYTSTEVLLRARVAAVGSQAALALGQDDTAVALAEQALGVDPGAFRRIGGRLPVQIESDQTPAAIRAAQLLEGSPLFQPHTRGLRLVLGAESVALLLGDGSVVAEADVEAGDDEDADAVARRIARAAHRGLMSARVDITQADIRSLDGGMGGGRGARERVDLIMDSLIRSRATTPPARGPQ